jgi:hypothetical protein
MMLFNAIINPAENNSKQFWSFSFPHGCCLCRN